MRILLMTIGTRGCEPFMAVAEMLWMRGDEVNCAFPEQYRGLAQGGSFPFHPLGTELIALAYSEAGR